MKSVISRIEKLEQAATQHNFLSQVSHRIIQRGETYAEAIAKYERESGRLVAPNDLVIVRVII